MTGPIHTLVSAARAGGPASVRAAARLMSLVSDDPGRLVELLQAVGGPGSPEALEGRPRLLLGVTGPPGSGKSTLTDAIVREVRRRRPDTRVGVVAVDPSSPFTGGAVLGDRVRMMRHATDPLVFVRSLASRGHLGGLTPGVKGVVRVMGLIGCDLVVLETVGVGQNEIEVAETADLVTIVLAPGQGDSVQLLKAGLLEIGNLFVVNKADRPDAARLHGQLLAMLERQDRLPGEIRLAAPDGCHGAAPAAGPRAEVRRRIFLANALENRGVPEIVDALDGLLDVHGADWQARRVHGWADEVRCAVLNEARRRLSTRLSTDATLVRYVEEALEGARTLTEVVDTLLGSAAPDLAHPSAVSNAASRGTATPSRRPRTKRSAGGTRAASKTPDERPQSPRSE